MIWGLAREPFSVRSPLCSPAFNNVFFDISWSEVAKFIAASTDSPQVASALLNRHPDRFLFGTDEVAPRISGRFSERIPSETFSGDPPAGAQRKRFAK